MWDVTRDFYGMLRMLRSFWSHWVGRYLSSRGALESFCIPVINLTRGNVRVQFSSCWDSLVTASVNIFSHLCQLFFCAFKKKLLKVKHMFYARCLLILEKSQWTKWFKSPHWGSLRFVERRTKNNQSGCWVGCKVIIAVEKTERRSEKRAGLCLSFFLIQGLTL